MKDDQILQYMKDIFSEGKYDNDFFNLVNGYCFIEHEGKPYNTGIIKSEHIAKILKKHNFIKWNDIFDQSKYLADFGIRYVLRIIKFTTSISRFEKESPFDEHGNIKLAYITSNNHVMENEVHLNTKVKFSYTAPFIYTSTFNNHFSECSVDIFKDRLSQKVRYDKGMIVSVENKFKNEFFYMDRKANVSNICWYIKNSLEKNSQYKDIFLNQKELDDLKKFVSEFLKEINSGLDNKTLVEKIIHLTNILKFSFFGFLLFEIVHEYFVEKGFHIFKANQLMRIVSPNQFVLWSMRSFTISSFREMLLKLSAVIPDFNDEEFIDFVAGEFSYRIYSFVGPNEEFLEDCVVVSMFSEKVHAIELSEVDLDESKNYISDEVFEKLKDSNESEGLFDKDNYGYNIKNPLHNIPKLIEISDAQTKLILQNAYKNYLIKACYGEIRKEMKVDIVEYVYKNDIGSVMANLQPDDRGEYMLLPNYISGVKYICKSFTLDKAMNIENLSENKALHLK